MNRVVIILLVLFGLWSEYAEGQYFDRYVIYDESGLVSSKEPLKSVMQLDLDILKKNKVKEVKVNYTKSSYRIYNILDSGFLSEINSFPITVIATILKNYIIIIKTIKQIQ